jgi:uncharacterized protein involved in exopolysaccharide biosynthesis
MSDRGSTPDQIVPADLASVHLHAIARRWWLVAVVALIAGVLSYLVSSQQPKEYDATALVLLNDSDPVNMVFHLTTPPSGDPERDLNTQVALVRLESTALTVRSSLGLDVTPDELLSQVSAGPQGTSNLIGLTARDHSPERAAAIANAFAAQYIVTLRNQAQAAYADAANQARERLLNIPAATRQGPATKSLRRREHQLRVLASLQTGDAQLVSRATPSTTPATPRPKFAAAVGVFIGMLLGALAAVALGAVDRRRRSKAPVPPPVESSGNGHVENPEIILPPGQSAVTAVTTHPDSPRT